MAELKIERNEMAAVLIVFLLSFGVGHYPAKSTLPDFTYAISMQAALSGRQAPVHVQLVSYNEQAFASVLGMPANSPKAIVQFLLFFPPLLLAVTALFLYLSLRQFGFKRSAAAFGALMFSLSLSSLQFLPGVMGSMQLASPMFAIFLFLFAYFISKESVPALGASALFGAAAAYINPVFGIAGIAAALSFAVPVYQKNGKTLVLFGLLLAVFAAAAYISPEKSALFFSTGSLQSIFSLAPFLLAAASCCLALFFLSSGRIEHLLLLIAGALVAAFSPVAGAMFLSIPASAGIVGASEPKIPKAAKFACAFLLATVAIVGITSPLMEFYKSVAVSAMIALFFPVLLYLYEYRNAQMFAVLGASLLALSLFFAFFYSLPPQKDFYPQYSEKDLAGALQSMPPSASKVSMIGSQDAARFYLPSASLGSQQEMSSYLLSGKPKPAPGSLIIVSLSYFDDQGILQNGSSQFESYSFAGNATSGSGTVALFVSSGSALVRELDSQGNLALKDGSLLDSAGRSYSSVPLSRMLLLSPDKPFYDPQNRLLVLEDGSSIPYFVKIYSGQSGELGNASSFGKVSVYEVK